MATPLPGPPKRKPCPTPTKQHFPTMDLAERAMIAQLGEMIQRERHDRQPVRVYPCPCGQWHMTSHEKKGPGHERADSQGQADQ